MAGMDLPVRAIREQVASAVDLIVHQARLKDGTRRITHITEIIGMEGDVVTLQDLFVFDFSAGQDEHGRFRGGLRLHRPAPALPGASRHGRGRGAARRVRLPAGAAVRRRWGVDGGACRRGGAGVGGGGARRPQAPTLAVTAVRPGVDRVQFTLSARGLPDGASLAKSEVQVEAGGVPLRASTQPIGDPARQAASTARTVIVVVDGSGSMAGSPLKAAQAAAAEFAKALPDDIHVGLVKISDRPVTLLRPTADRAAFRAAVAKIQVSGDTALYDSVQQAVGLFATTAERRILVLSDGADTSSAMTLSQLTASVRRARTPVDVVGFGAAATGGGPTGAALRQLASGTGGELHNARDSAALAAAFRSAATSFSVPVAVSAEVPRSLAGKTTTLRATVDVAGQRLTGTAPVTFPAVSAISKGPSHYFAPAIPGWLFGGVSVLVFLALLGLALVVLRPLFTDPDRRRRIAEVGPLHGTRSREASGRTERRSDHPHRARSQPSAWCRRRAWRHGRSVSWSRPV